MSAAIAAKDRGDSPARRYPLNTAFFNEALREAVHEALFSPRTLVEKQEVKLKPNFDTACWAFVPPHKIFIGTDLFEKPMVLDGLGKTQQAKYIANHYHHEVGHGLFTERNMSKIKLALSKISAPFPVYNLFEDAYMEERYRKETGYRFEWLDLERFDFTPRPESLLFALIQAEGNLSAVDRALAAWEPAPLPAEDPMTALLADSPAATQEKLQGLLPRVFAYYRRIVGVKESMELIPELKAWLDEFGRPPPPPPGGAKGSGSGSASNNGGMADLELSANLMTDPQALKDFEQDAESPDGDDPPGPGGGKKKGPVRLASLVGRTTPLLHSIATPVDQERVQRLVERFKKFFEEKSRPVSTRAPQRRLSARHLALGRAPFRKDVRTGRARQKVFFEVDCSGSMGGRPIDEGKVIISALSKLASQGYVSGHVALSAVMGQVPAWELHKLPMTQEDIDHIQGFAEAEGLEFTLREHLKLAKAADHVFVYTDAQICDKPIDKADFHRQGVYTWGLYAGSDRSCLDELMRYFDKAIMRDTAEDLVDAMLAQLS